MLGGISALGGNALGKTAIKNLDNASAALKRVARVAGGAVSEFSEEYLQEILTPLFRNIALGTGEEVKVFSEEALYSGFLGALTGGTVEAAGTGSVSGNYKAAQPAMETRGAKPTQKTELAMHLDRVGEMIIDNGQQKIAVPEEAAVNVRSAGTALTEENREKDTLAYALASKLDSVRDMEPVSLLTGNEFKKTGDGAKISDKLREFFRSLGNKVSRTGFGDVELGEYGIGAFLTHKPINRARAVSMAAVPDVIKSGRQIGYDPNWKGRGYPSYIFAAPVNIAGTDVYVAAVVNQLPDNKFYLSEMVDSEGNYVRIEESPSGNSKNGLPMGPENQQGRGYAGPEGLSEGSNPSGSAEPMPLPKNIIPRQKAEVNGDIVEGRAQGMDTREPSAAGEQTGFPDIRGIEKDMDGNVRQPIPAKKVHFDRRGKQLSAVQETALTRMEQLSVLLDVEFEVFESYISAAGKRVYRDENGVEQAAPNGWYDPATGKIHVDLNAGAGGKGTMIFTVAHELTHFIRQWSPAKFDKLAEAVFELVYREKNISVVELVRRQQEKAARNNMELSFEEAYEEMVADSMEGILTSGNVVELMAEVKQRDLSLWEKLREWFRSLAEDIKKLVRAYQGYKPDSVEGRAVASMKELLPVIEGFYADALMEASENRRGAEEQKNTTREGGKKGSFRGYDKETGRGIYEGNFPKGTPKSAKAARILTYIQNVWSKEPIALIVRNNDGSEKRILAEFDPTYDEKDGLRSDASKLMGGNRHGTSSEQRVTLDLADDYYQIASESVYNYSKPETGKDSVTHQGVQNWHYFINDIMFREYGESKMEPYRVTVNVKEKKDGSFVYSFSAERQEKKLSTHRTLHADVTPTPKSESNAQLSKTSIRNPEAEVKKKLSARDFGGSEPANAKTEYFRDFEAQDDLYQQMLEEYIAGDDERVQHRRRNRWKNSKEPADAWEWSVFNRSFANKTNGLKSGGTRNIMITTADHAYFVAADGYMSGEIIAKMNLNTQMREIEEFRREFVYADTGTEISDPMAEGYRHIRGGNDWDHAGDGYTGEAGAADGLDGGESPGDTIGGYWENYGYPSYDELIEAIESGAMVMDDNGDLITLPDGWDQHRSDDEDYEQWLRELLAREG